MTAQGSRSSQFADRLHRGILGVVAIGVILLAQVARAQEVGTIAEIEGSVEIGRSGTWSAATIDAPVQFRDELRTGRPGRLRVVFQDDTVLNIGDDSHLLIDEQVFDPNQGSYRSAMHLLKGRVRALVSDYYQRPHASYHIETPTAVSGVRGTEFVVSYDATTEITEVVGVSGRVEVHSPLDRARRGVFVTAQEITSVTRGQFPTPPTHLSDALFQQYLGGLDFIGHGQSESLTIGHPLLAGNAILQADRSGAFAPPSFVGLQSSAPINRSETRRDASNLLHQSPGILRALRNNRGDLGVRF